MRKRKPSNFPIWILVAGGSLLLISAVLFAVQNGANRTLSQPSATVSDQEATYSEIERVSLTNAKAALDAGTAVFVDVRDAEGFAGGHIPGALPIPLAELETRLSELDPNQWVITYCT